MAAVPRTPATGAPSATTAAAPMYAAPAALSIPSGAFNKRIKDTSLLTGTIAIPRSQSGPLTETQLGAVERAQENAAAQRVSIAGLGSEYTPVVLDYYRQTGRFPDLSQLSLEEQATAGGPSSLFTPMNLAIGAAVVVAVVLLGRKR